MKYKVISFKNKSFALSVCQLFSILLIEQFSIKLNFHE